MKQLSNGQIDAALGNAKKVATDLAGWVTIQRREYARAAIAADRALNGIGEAQPAADDKCLACGGRGFHDFGHGDYRDCPDCAADKPGCDFCNHPLYAGRKCKNCGRVDESFDDKAAQPVAKIVRNETGQIRLCDANGDAFDMSKHIGAQFYTTPPTPAVPDGLIDALKRQRQVDDGGTECGVLRQAVDEAITILELLSAAPQPEKAG